MILSETTVTVNRAATAKSPARAEVLKYDERNPSPAGEAWSAVRHQDIEPGLYAVLDLNEGEAVRVFSLPAAAEERPMDSILKG
jgi:hypothetical protein